MFWRDDSSIPAGVRQGLGRFCDDVAAVAADNLVAIILYGGVARREYEPSSSDVNVLLVLRTVDLAALERIRPILQTAQRDIELDLLTLTPRDVARSASAFPIKFLDMKTSHRVLHGEDVLSKLEIHRDHLRLRCEQEIRNLMLRLRRYYLTRGGSPLLLEQTLTHAISAFLRSLRVVMMLKQIDAPVQKQGIAETAGRHLDLDGRTLVEILDLKFGRMQADDTRLRDLYGRFLRTVEQAADIVDAL